MPGELDRTPFMTASFEGRRYNGGRLLLSVLKDLVALNDLIADLGRQRYLARNTDRKRLPKGYRPKQSLWISTVSDGSAQAVIERSPETQLTLITQPDPLEEARDIVLAAIQAVGAGSPLPSEFPAWCRRRFNAIGRSLGQTEALAFSTPTSVRTCRLTPEVRRRMVAQVAPIEEDFSAIGTLQGFVAATRSFEVQTADGRIAGTFVQGLDRDFRDAIGAGEETGLYIDGALPFRVDGTGTTRSGALLSFVADSLTAVDFKDGTFQAAAERVRELVDAEPGWLDGAGEAVDRLAAEHVLAVLAHLAELEIGSPFIFPSVEGGIRVEWELETTEVVWESGPDGRSHYLTTRGIGTEDLSEVPVPLGLTASDVAEHVALVVSAAAGDGNGEVDSDE